jgi:hypothetical protein
MPWPEAEPVPTATQLAPSNRSTNRCGVPPDRSRQNTTGPPLVATTFASSTAPTPLMPPADNELPSAIQAPCPPFAVASNSATRIDDPSGPIDVHATTGLPPTMVMDGSAAEPVAPCSPVPMVLPARSVQVPLT